MDPRIPDDHEAFQFQMTHMPPGAKIDWYVDDKLSATTLTPSYLWPLSKGAHSAMAKIWPVDSKSPVPTPLVNFVVK
jgi:hypothetical protein